MRLHQKHLSINVGCGPGGVTGMSRFFNHVLTIPHKTLNRARLLAARIVVRKIMPQMAKRIREEQAAYVHYMRLIRNPN
jgi:hypothetical protein